MKKYLYIMLTIVLLASMLVACAPAQEAPAAEEPVSEEEAAPASEEEAAPASEEEAAEEPAEEVVIRMLTMQQAGPTPDEMDEIAARFSEANPGVTVEITYLAYDEIYDKIVVSVPGDNPAFDIVLVDDIWFSQMAEAGWLYDVTDWVPAETKENVFEAAWEISSVNGKIYGMPWLLDQKYFYYNMEMLEQAGYDAPPATWEELEEMGMKMKEMGLVEYPIVWSWAQAECAICDFVTLLGGNGARLFDENNEPTFNSPDGVEVVQWMIDSINKGISNPSSLAAYEEDVRSVFSSGKAAFATNWGYMYDLANFNEEESQVVGKVGMSLMPVFEKGKQQGIDSATIDGSMGFAVTANSPNAETAWEYVKFLTSEEIQMEFSKHMLPVWETSFQEPHVQTLMEINPSSEVYVPMFGEQFPYSLVRPKVPYYTEASLTIQLALQKALSGTTPAQEALDEAVETIKGLE